MTIYYLLNQFGQKDGNKLVCYLFIDNEDINHLLLLNLHLSFNQHLLNRQKF